MSYYPPFPEDFDWTLEIILRNAEQEPGYFDSDDCPYTEKTIAMLRPLTGAEIHDGESGVDDFDTGNRWDVLQQESRALFKDLRDTRNNLDERDNAERMSYFRTATSLLDKIVGIQERAANLKEIHKFHETVLTVMEDILAPDQRTEVLDRLRKAIKGED